MRPSILRHQFFHKVCEFCVLFMKLTLKLIFFSRIQTAEKQYIDAFEEELSAFRKRVELRAKERIEMAMKEVEEEERQKRLGPGGLDPAEVFETLPDILQKCFEERDIEGLKTVSIVFHFTRCYEILNRISIPGAVANGRVRGQTSYETLC